eukprot:6134050-Pleurochrysis_carterae.AAC.3
MHYRRREASAAERANPAERNPCLASAAGPMARARKIGHVFKATCTRCKGCGGEEARRARREEQQGRVMTWEVNRGGGSTGTGLWQSAASREEEMEKRRSTLRRRKEQRWAGKGRARSKESRHKGRVGENQQSTKTNTMGQTGREGRLTELKRKHVNRQDSGRKWMLLHKELPEK